MPSKPIRQVTPPGSRIWLFGIVSAALASTLNYGWLYLCTDVFHWAVQVPAALDVTSLVAATPTRIIVATSAAVAVATIGANLLAKTVIGPRIWWLVIASGVGVASTYAVLTLTDIELLVRVRLAVMHVLTMVVVIPLMYRALHIRDSDLAHADRRWHDHVEQRTPTHPATPGDVITATAPRLELDDYVGMTEEEAMAAAAAAGVECRVMSRDGQHMTTTLDFRADRVNLVVEGGSVRSVSVG